MRLYPPPVPGSVAATLKRSGMSAYFFGAKAFCASQSYTNWPAGPSLPVGLSIWPSFRASSTTSFGSIRLRTSVGSIAHPLEYRLRPRCPRGPLVDGRRHADARGDGGEDEDDR